MNRISLCHFFVLLGSLLSLSHQQPALVAKIFPASGTFTSGQVVVTPGGSGVRFEVNIGGVNPNTTLALHVHQYGDLSTPDGVAAGAHFNPFNVAHGCAPSSVRHVGDIGNITSDSKGLVAVTLSSELVSLDPNSRSYVGGLGVIIHATFDNCVTPNTGNAGVRIGMGVLGFARGSTFSPDEVITGKTPEVYGCNFLEHPTIRGKVVFLFVNDTTNVVNITGLAPLSYYTLKITNTGDLRYETKIMDTVWNYDNSEHGCPGSLKYKAGDLGTFRSDENGNALFYTPLPKLSLFNNTMKSPLGRTLYILSGKDSCTSSSDTDSDLVPVTTCVIGEYAPNLNSSILVNVPKLAPIVSSASSLGLTLCLTFLLLILSFSF